MSLGTGRKNVQASSAWADVVSLHPAFPIQARKTTPEAACMLELEGTQTCQRCSGRKISLEGAKGT